MTEEIITRDSAAFKELRRDIVKAIRAVDILIDTHLPVIGNELYLTIVPPASSPIRPWGIKYCSGTTTSGNFWKRT